MKEQLIGLIGATLVAIGSLISPQAHASSDTTLIYDGMTQYAHTGCPGYGEGTSFGPWRVQFTGYGCVTMAQREGARWMRLVPKAATAANQTHGTLVTGPVTTGDMSFSGRTKTAVQLRQNTAPNAWETSWLVWQYTDNSHFYYFVPKSNGWELGKRDPAYPGGQRFLATGNSPRYAPGAIKNFQIIQTGTTITVSINGSTITSLTDTERPYTRGAVGLYTEDADVLFTALRVTQSPTEAAQPAKPAAPARPQAEGPQAIGKVAQNDKKLQDDQAKKADKKSKENPEMQSSSASEGAVAAASSTQQLAETGDISYLVGFAAVGLLGSGAVLLARRYWL